MTKKEIIREQRHIIEEQRKTIERLESLLGAKTVVTGRAGGAMQTQCFHENRVWVTGKVVKDCYHTGEQLRERTQYCRSCGVETDSDTFWD